MDEQTDTNDEQGIEVEAPVIVGCLNLKNGLYYAGDKKAANLDYQPLMDVGQFRRVVTALQGQVASSDARYLDACEAVTRNADYARELFASRNALLARTTVVPEGFLLMPGQITAENGAKGLMLGEFKVEHQATCPDCQEGDADPECEICQGEVQYTQLVTVPWDTVKEMYARAVKHLSAPAGPPDTRPCRWEYDEADYCWTTSCGTSWTLIDGTPKENHIHFCHACGKPMEQVEPEEPADPLSTNDRLADGQEATGG